VDKKETTGVLRFNQESEQKKIIMRPEIHSISDLDALPQFTLLKCVSGSRAYGLDTASSDTDIRGIFIVPRTQLFGLRYTEQVNNQSQDEVFYEIKKFIHLLKQNNPNILELLNAPRDSVLFRHPLLGLIRPQDFLSKLCKVTFAGYAQAQIKKAKGLNKKIVNPVEKERKSPLDFCYVIKGQGTIPLLRWLEENKFKQEDCGLVNLPHMRDVYALFHSSQFAIEKMKGISSGEDANDVSLSSVPEGVSPLAVMSFNKDGYSQYCKTYREYWDWVANRNEARYENTIEHGKNYDAKNLMHTIRLLTMAEEIALYKEVRVRRPDREFLLDIRRGKYEYDELVKIAEEKTARINELFEKSDLPEKPDEDTVENLLLTIRERFYAAFT
jgi:uncharacterized protein